MEQGAHSIVSGVRDSLISVPPARLLLLGCTRAKTQFPHLLPALQRYDGPAFRLVRRYMREQGDQRLQIYVLSAEFGLIPANHPIPLYDCRMTPGRARALEGDVRNVLCQILPSIDLDESNGEHLLVVLGKDYVSALAGYQGAGAAYFCSRVVGGGQGRKLSTLYDWLYGTPPDAIIPRQSQIHSVKFRGAELHLERNDVFEIARNKLCVEPGSAHDVSAWYVEVDGARVALKWLVKHVTGCPVRYFSTTDARRLLARFGIKAERA